MSERVDEKIKQIISETSGEPGTDVKARALEAMREVSPRPAGSRLRWLPTVTGTALVVAALALAPYGLTPPTAGMSAAFAAQEALAAATGGEIPEARAGAERESLPEPLRWYGEHAADFVEEHYPDDPDMLIAAGVLTRDRAEAQMLLKSAVEKGDSGAAWFAYAQAVMESGPGYCRVAGWAVDPGNPEEVAEATRDIAASGTPGKLIPAEAEPVLDVLRQWQAVEPENALPLAFEMYYLYGLHRDQEALARWEAAGELPEVNPHTQEFTRYSARLLDAMGMSPWESLTNAVNSGFALGTSSKLRACARIGVYEGRLAELEGRDQEAIQWWRATFRFGEHMQESSDTLIGCLVGIAIQGMGGAPVWIWHPDRVSGISDGPLFGGRLFHGESYEFFVRQAGAQAAEQIRDSLLKAKVRSMLSREYSKQFEFPPAGLSRAMVLRSFAGMSVLLLLASLLGFGAVSVWARRKADEATRLGWRERLLLTLISLTPLATGWMLAWRITAESGSLTGAAGLLMLGGSGLSALLLLALPLAVAFWSRPPGAGRLTAWRGNLRRVLPLAAVGLALLSLGLVGASRTTEARWVQDWLSETELQRVVETIGPAWHNPAIPPDAWRDEPVPEATSELDH